MKNRKIEKIVIGATLLFILIAVWFMFGDRFPSGSGNSRKGDSAIMPEASGSTEVISNGNVVEQSFICSTKTISQVGIVFIKESYPNGINVTIELLKGDKTVAKNTYDVADIEEHHRTYVIPKEVLTGTKNKEFTIKIYTVDDSDTGLRVLMSENSDSSFKFGRQTLKGTLCFSVTE